jgi:hypothetical protein
MTGKVIDNSATGILVLILPFAFVIVLLFKAWPLLLALLIFSLCLRIWQHYQWKQWSKQVNPFFNELIKENQGCLTPLDLSIKANLSAGAAKRFLDKKAEEYGARCQPYEDKGTVYYFLTASALGSLFDDSEPTFDPEGETLTSFAPKLSAALTQSYTSEPKIDDQLDDQLSDANSSLEPSQEETSLSSESSATIDEVEADQETAEETAEDSKPNYAEAFEEIEDSSEEESDNQPQASKSLIQSELAKRLDVHSSTIGKRKSDPDFSEWSQSRDPDGIAWKYSRKTKEFLPVNDQQ